MDPSDEVRLREIQREYLDFLDDDVICNKQKNLIVFWTRKEKIMKHEIFIF